MEIQVPQIQKSSLDLSGTQKKKLTLEEQCKKDRPETLSCLYWLLFSLWVQAHVQKRLLILIQE
jgi:hypothetical protein